MLLGLLNVSDADVSRACEGSGSKLFVSIRISGLRSGAVSGSTPLKLFRKSSQLDRFSTLEGEKSACNVLRRKAFSSRSRARVCASSLLLLRAKSGRLSCECRTVLSLDCNLVGNCTGVLFVVRIERSELRTSLSNSIDRGRLGDVGLCETSFVEACALTLFAASMAAFWADPYIELRLLDGVCFRGKLLT